MMTKTFKTQLEQLENQRLNLQESQKLARSMTKQLWDLYHNCEVTPLPEPLDPLFDEKCKQHRKEHNIEHIYFNLAMSVDNFSYCFRRSMKMSKELYYWRTEAEKMGLFE